MKKEVIQLCQKHMEKLYLESKKQLLDIASYNKEVDIQNARLFLNFLENALTKPFNRLHSLNAFINNDGALSTDRMYPFCNLSDETKGSINEKDEEAIDLATGLDTGRIDPDLQSLCYEEHLQISNASEQ